MTASQLTDRQREILSRVVEEYVGTGNPVGSQWLVSRWLVDGSEFAVSPSTVRAELAELERLGLLTHPHTSAGRVPTEAGYRVYVDGLLARQEPRPAGGSLLELGTRPPEVDDALQATTEILSQLTRLLALVSAPPLEAATVRHVDVLQLQPTVVVEVITTTTTTVGCSCSTSTCRTVAASSGGAETSASRRVSCERISVVACSASSTSGGRVPSSSSDPPAGRGSCRASSPST